MKKRSAVDAVIDQNDTPENVERALSDALLKKRKSDMNVFYSTFGLLQRMPETTQVIVQESLIQEYIRDHNIRVSPIQDASSDAPKRSARRKLFDESNDVRRSPRAKGK